MRLKFTWFPVCLMGWIHPATQAVTLTPPSPQLWLLTFTVGAEREPVFAKDHVHPLAVPTDKKRPLRLPGVTATDLQDLLEAKTSADRAHNVKPWSKNRNLPAWGGKWDWGWACLRDSCYQGVGYPAGRRTSLSLYWSCHWAHSWRKNGSCRGGGQQISVHGNIFNSFQGDGKMSCLS